MMLARHQQLLPFRRSVAGNSQALGDDRDRPEVEQHMVIRAKTQDVVHCVLPVVRASEWPYVGGLRIRGYRSGQRDPAYLTRVVIDAFDLSSDGGVPNDPLDRLGDTLRASGLIAQHQGRGRGELAQFIAPPNETIAR